MVSVDDCPSSKQNVRHINFFIASLTAISTVTHNPSLRIGMSLPNEGCAGSVTFSACACVSWDMLRCFVNVAWHIIELFKVSGYFTGLLSFIHYITISRFHKLQEKFYATILLRSLDR